MGGGAAGVGCDAGYGSVEDDRGGYYGWAVEHLSAAGWLAYALVEDVSARLILLGVLACSLGAEDFSAGMRDWWSEGGERVWVEDGRLHVRADDPKVEGGAVATVWWKIPHGGDFELEFDAHVVSSSIDTNNINLFFSYADPSGTPLEASKADRRDAKYERYHELNGYIVTFVNDGGQRRVRIRRNPGFRLLGELFGGSAALGVTRHVVVRKRGGEISVAIDGKPVLTARDAKPLGGGLLGLRTFRSWVWWDNIVLRRVD